MSKAFRELLSLEKYILDCTEIVIEMPTYYRGQSATFPIYKHHKKAKWLIGIALSRSVPLASELYTVQFNDKKMTRDS